MKPFGLEGKVGAPAIVRTNPLLRKYDEEFGPSDTRPSVIDRLIAESFLPFSWRDVLGVVSERYVGKADNGLTSFLRACSAVLPDRVLEYDLDTPRFDVSFEWTVRDVTRIISGSCRNLICSRYAFITGDAEDIWLDGFAIITGRVGQTLSILRESCVFATVQSAQSIESPGYLGKNGVLLTKNAGNYLMNGRPITGIFDDTLGLRSICDRAISIDPRSPTLHEEMEELHNEYLHILPGLVEQRRGASR